MATLVAFGFLAPPAQAVDAPTVSLVGPVKTKDGTHIKIRYTCTERTSISIRVTDPAGGDEYNSHRGDQIELTCDGRTQIETFFLYSIIGEYLTPGLVGEATINVFGEPYGDDPYGTLLEQQVYSVRII